MISSTFDADVACVSVELGKMNKFLRGEVDVRIYHFFALKSFSISFFSAGFILRCHFSLSSSVMKLNFVLTLT